MAKDDELDDIRPAPRADAHTSRRRYAGVLHDADHMPVTYLTQDLPEGWSAETAIAIYKITQEALRNVAEHAGKTHVKVILSGKEDRLELRVMDFGLSFDQDGEGVTGRAGNDFDAGAGPAGEWFAQCSICFGAGDNCDRGGAV